MRDVAEGIAAQIAVAGCIRQFADASAIKDDDDRAGKPGHVVSAREPLLEQAIHGGDGRGRLAGAVEPG